MPLLNTPHIINLEQGELEERRSLSSKIYSPSPFKERGIQGVRSIILLFELKEI